MGTKLPAALPSLPSPTALPPCHTQAQRSLEARVLAGREELWVDPLGSRREALAERDRLVGRISSQGARLEELRLQLAAMRRKDSAVHGV